MVLAACASKPTLSPPVAPPAAAAAVPSPPPTPPTPGLEPRERLRKVLELLDAGRRDQARAEAQELVKQQPDDPRSKSLLKQIDTDPKQLLGEQNFPYTIKAGETLSMLAERFLGDKFLFYALARYNGIDAPRSAEVGRTIMVPGVAREVVTPQPVRRKAPEAAPLRRPLSPAAPPPPAPVHDVAHANALRSQALVLMNRGQIDGAVGLLRQAAALDPGNLAISRDLTRAVRLQADAKR